MSNRNRAHRRKQKQERHLVVRSIRRNPLDYKKLAGALIELAMAQAEADAQAEDNRKKTVHQRRADHAEHQQPVAGEDGRAGDLA